jgi:mono/diheme cytochrome c family protein
MKNVPSTYVAIGATWLVLGIVLASASHAAERIVHLKLGKGLNKVEASCGGCHSLDYVPMNSPFLNAVAWDAEVTKMINVYGAPIEKADAKIISDYLKTNYGRTLSPPRRPPTFNAQKPQGDGLFPPSLQNPSLQNHVDQRNGPVPKSD